MENTDEPQRAAEQEIQAEIERRWHEAETAEQAGLYGWEQLYLEAANYATEQAARVTTPLTEALARQAEVRFRQANRLANLFGLPAKGEFKRLLDELRILKPERRIVISRDPHQLEATAVRVPVYEAIKIVERQARDYAAEIAVRYRDRGLKLLEEHDPEAAEQEILKAYELFGLDEEERQRCRHLQEDKIKPAVERRAQARALLMEAQRTGDPREAWQLLTEAERLDPFAPGLDQMRHELVQRTSVYADMFLAHVGDLLRQVRQLAAYDVELQTLVAKAEAALTVLFPVIPPPMPPPPSSKLPPNTPPSSSDA